MQMVPYALSLVLDYPHRSLASWCGSYQVVNELFQAGGLVSAITPVLPRVFLIQGPAGALRGSAFTSFEPGACRGVCRSTGGPVRGALFQGTSGLLTTPQGWYDVQEVAPASGAELSGGAAATGWPQDA